MFGPFSLHSEVFGGANESASKKGLPEAIYDDSRGERVFGMSEPLCKRESIGGLYTKAWEEFGKGSFDFFTTVLVRSSIKNVCLFWLPRFLHDHNFGNRFLEAIISGASVLQFLNCSFVGRCTFQV